MAPPIAITTTNTCLITIIIIKNYLPPPMTVGVQRNQRDACPRGPKLSFN